VNVDGPIIPAAGFSVYPNPAKDQLFVRANQNTTGIIILSDIHGRLIKKVSIQDHLTSIDTGNLKSGMCFVKFVSDHFVEVQKIMIEKMDRAISHFATAL
jgi:hypothetical protein